MENKTKHTPGPWKYRPNKYDDWGVVRSADGLPVAQACVGRWSKDFDTHRTNNTDPGEANARLIAAAPELLAALEKISNQISKPALRSIQDCGQLGVYFTAKEINDFRAAIAKAKGN